MSNPTSNFNWQMPTNTDLVTDLPADFEVFGQAVDTTLADLKGGTSGQILSKNSNTDMDFVWIANDQGDITGITATSPLTGGGTSGAVTVGIQSATTSQSGAVQLSDSTSTTSSILASTPTATKAAYDLANAAVPKSTVTAKGSIFTATASATPAQIVVGTNGYGLVADSTASTGLAWKQEGLTLIASTAFSGASTIAIDNVFSASYANYLVEIVTTSGSGGAAEIQMRYRTSGTPNTNTQYYNSGTAYTYAGSADAANQNPANYAFVFRTSGAEWCGRLNVYNPFASQKTWHLGQYADQNQNGYRGGYFSGTTSFDGVQFFNSGATNIAGTIRVYGLAN